ncbi:MAG: ABC transporter ATP-binding protein [Clostridiales bacterium]|nr:ABC transporter ATP-binding protein [Clostridiales bacterium]
MLKAEHVTKYYQNSKVIEDVSVEVKSGELVCLLGASGIGKTTLFQILSGLVRPDEGAVYLAGEDITGQPGKMSYMQQKDLLLPFETVINNVSIPLVLAGTPKKEAHAKAFSYFSEFRLEGCERKYPHQLSGGMRQRAALLRAYLFSGELMLLDEPFSALDVMTKAAMQKWFVKIFSTHRSTALFITHDVDEAILLSDRIYIMAGVPGKICHEIKLDSENRSDPDFLVSQRFLECKRLVLGLHLNG